MLLLLFVWRWDYTNYDMLSIGIREGSTLDHTTSQGQPPKIIPKQSIKSAIFDFALNKADKSEIDIPTISSHQEEKEGQEETCGRKPRSQPEQHQPHQSATAATNTASPRLLMEQFVGLNSPTVCRRYLRPHRSHLGQRREDVENHRRREKKTPALTV